MTILNPAPARPLPAAFPRLVDVIVPNEGEAQALTGSVVRTVADARRAARSLARSGFGCAIVTLGSRGLIWTDGGTVHRVMPHRVRARDQTAAGDTFVGYLACALAERRPMAGAIALANAAAAIAVTRAGAQPSIPHRAEVERFLSAETPGQ